MGLTAGAAGRHHADLGQLQRDEALVAAADKVVGPTFLCTHEQSVREDICITSKRHVYLPSQRVLQGQQLLVQDVPLEELRRRELDVQVSRQSVGSVTTACSQSANGPATSRVTAADLSV